MKTKGFGNRILAAVVALAIAGSARAAIVAQWGFELPDSTGIGSPLASDTDSVGGLVATGVGSPTYAAPAPGVGGTASLSLSGGAYARVTDAPRLTGHDGGATGFGTFTVDLYLKLDADPGATMQIVRKTGLSGSNTPGFELFAQPGGKIGFGIHEADGTTHTGVVSGILAANQWQHIVANWDGSVGTVSVDGVDTGIAIAYDKPFVDTDVDLGIGALIRSNGSVGQTLSGSIDALTISGTLVPEPASLGLVALGGGLAAMARRRRR